MQNLTIIVFGTIISILLGVNLWLTVQLRRLRIRANKIIEEKAKATEEADKFAELIKNPLGPLMNQDASPLILKFDKTGQITEINETLLQKLNHKKKDILGKNILETILPKPQKPTESIVYRLFKNPNLFIDTETEIKTKSGETIWISWTNKMQYSKNGKPIQVTSVGFDITKRKQMEAELKYLSSIDPQTGVMNRHALIETGTIELKRAKRYKRTLSVVILEFESLNNLTDKTLQNITKIIRTVIRSVDYIGRIGDTEFALILPETSEEKVPFLINRLNQNINELNNKTTKLIKLKYGTASLNKKTDNIDTLFNKALKNTRTTKNKPRKK